MSKALTPSQRLALAVRSANRMWLLSSSSSIVVAAKWSLERRHLDLRAERRLDERHRHGDAQVVAVEGEHRERLDVYADDEVAVRAAELAGPALAAQPDLLPRPDPGWDPGGDGAHAAHRVVDAQAQLRALDGLPERERDVGGEVLAAARAARGPEARLTVGAAAEHRQDVLEAGTTAGRPPRREADVAAAPAEEVAEDVLEAGAAAARTQPIRSSPTAV